MAGTDAVKFIGPKNLNRYKFNVYIEYLNGQESFEHFSYEQPKYNNF